MKEAEVYYVAKGKEKSTRHGLKCGVSRDVVAKSAKSLGVGVESFGEHGLALRYSVIDTSQIHEGVRRLMKAINSI